MGITVEKTGKTYCISAAFPSACGKTNMLTPGLPGFKVSCVGEYTLSLIYLTINNFVCVCVCVVSYLFMVDKF